MKYVCKSCGEVKKSGAVANNLFFCTDCVEAEKDRRMKDLIKMAPKGKETWWNKIFKS